MKNKKRSLSAKKGWRRHKLKKLIRKVLITICFLIGVLTVGYVMAYEVKTNLITEEYLYSTDCNGVRVYHHKGELNDDVCSYHRDQESNGGATEPAASPPSVEEQIKTILKKYNKDQEFQDKLLCLIRNESGFDPEAINLNRHSVDFGILQYNSKLSPIKISGKCMFDIECSIDKFVEYIDNGGSWDRWYGYKYNCK